MSRVLFISFAVGTWEIIMIKVSCYEVYILGIQIKSTKLINK